MPTRARPRRDDAGAQPDHEMDAESRRRLALLLMFTTPACWAANYIVARAANGVVHPHMLAFLRWIMALGLMLPIAWPALARHWPAWRREWRELLLLGALGMWVCGAFVYEGARTTTALNISLIYAISPVLIAVASHRQPGERLRPLQWGGVAMALAGMLLVVVKGRLADLLAVRLTVGDLWVLSAALSWATYSIVLRRRASVLDPFARLTAITAAGVLVLLPFTVAEAAIAGVPEASWRVLGLAAVAALLPGFAAFQSYSFIQRELGAARTGLVLYLGPIYAALIAWWLLGEPPRWYHVAGAAMILPGIALATGLAVAPTRAGTRASAENGPGATR